MWLMPSFGRDRPVRADDPLPVDAADEGQELRDPACHRLVRRDRGRVDAASRVGARRYAAGAAGTLVSGAASCGRRRARGPAARSTRVTRSYSFDCTRNRAPVGSRWSVNRSSERRSAYLMFTATTCSTSSSNSLWGISAHTGRRRAATALLKRSTRASLPSSRRRSIGLIKRRRRACPVLSGPIRAIGRLRPWKARKGYGARARGVY